MTTDQKIERLLAQVARLKAQAQAKVDAGFVQTSTGQRLWGYVVGQRAAPTTAPVTATRTYYSYFASSCSRVATTVKAAVVAVGAIAKQAATAVCWTAPNWAWKQVLRGGAAVADAIWFAADLLEDAVYMVFSMLLLTALVIVVGYVIVTALTTTIGVALVLATLWLGMLNCLLNEDVQRRNAARP